MPVCLVAAAVLTSSVLAFVVVVVVGPDWNWDLGLGPDWNWYRRPSLSPQASPVGASVAFAKVQRFKYNFYFVTWYPQLLHNISMMGSATANLSSASDVISGTVMSESDLPISVGTFANMFPMQSAMGLINCLSKCSEI